MMLTVSTLSFGQGAPQWFLEKIHPYKGYYSNLGDSLWTNYIISDGNATKDVTNIPVKGFAMTVSCLDIEGIHLSDVFCFMGILRFGGEYDYGNVFFSVYDWKGSQLFHVDLGRTDLIGFETKGFILCGNTPDKMLVRVWRDGHVWKGIASRDRKAFSGCPPIVLKTIR